MLSLVLVAALVSPALPGSTDAAVVPTAQEEAGQSVSEWDTGTLELGILGGYAVGKVFDPPRTPTRFAQALFRVGIHFGATFEGLMRGNFALVAEGFGISVDQDPRATGGGVNFLLRYGWAGERWRPTLLVGTGVVFTDENVPPGENTYNFSPQAGIGLAYMLSENWSLGGEYRFHHMSNKGATESNPGINSHLFLFGISWFR
jgi:opacity protein-like surface antigen